MRGLGAHSPQQTGPFHPLETAKCQKVSEPSTELEHCASRLDHTLQYLAAAPGTGQSNPGVCLRNSTPFHGPGTNSGGMEKGGMKPSPNPIRRTIFLLFHSRPAQASPLRSEASRALRSRAKKSEPSLKRRLTPPEPPRRNQITPTVHSLFYASTGLKIGPTSEINFENDVRKSAEDRDFCRIPIFSQNENQKYTIYCGLFHWRSTCCGFAI